MAFHVLNGEVQPARAGPLVAGGDLLEEGEDVAPEGVELLGGQGEPGLAIDVVEVGARVAEPGGFARA